MNGLVRSCLLVISLGLIAFSANACGPNSQCKIGDRHYYIAMPAAHDGKSPIGALIFAHGYKGSGLGIIRNRGLRRITSELGVAFIAVKSKGSSWSLPNAPQASAARGANELAYFDAVKADATSRFAIDPDQVVVTGSSTGGMVTWTLACERSAAFAAFIPMSGTFWAPIPKTCRGPTTSIVHIHGDKDRTVPLGGRPIRETHQGDVHKALDMYRRFGEFCPARPEKATGLRCQNSINAQGNILNFCLYKGGHSFRSANVVEAWRMLKAAGQL